MKKAFIMIITVFLAVGLSIAGCSKKKPKSGKTAHKKTENKRGEADNSPKGVAGIKAGGENAEGKTPEAEEDVYSYNLKRTDGKIKQNPFEPITPKVVNRTAVYELSQLGVNGVLIHGVKKASVMTPDCLSTTVKIDDPIGIHGGKIVDISLKGVLVRETFVNIKGGIQEYDRLIANKPYKCNAPK